MLFPFIEKMVGLVYDYGNFFEVAKRLSQDMAKVYYFNPNIHDGFPDVKDEELGEGVKGVIKIKELESVIREIDFIFFTDCFEPDKQEYYRSIGKLVFGSGHSSLLETDREYFHKIIQEVGLPSVTYEVADGIDDLENKLHGKENVYIKSDHRGNHETTKWKNRVLSNGELRRMRKDMSIFGKDEKYLIVDQLQGVVIEIGFEAFCVNGKWTLIVATGCEIKDLGYIGKFMPYSELPKQLKNVGDKMAPIFEQLGYNGWHSNEVIITDDLKGYPIDLTQRMPQPPTTAMLANIINFTECAVSVAMNIVPEVKYKYKYVCQLILKSDIAMVDDTPIIVPDQYKEFVALKNMRVMKEMKDGKEIDVWYYTRRGIPMKEIGSIFGGGNTLDEAINMATMVYESIESEDAYADIGCLGKAQKELSKLSALGIKYI